MAASKAYTGKGTIFSFATTLAGTYTTVAELKTLQFSGTKSDMEDVTNMDSPSNFREKLPTLLDGGDFSLSGNYISNDAGRIGFNSAFLGQTLIYCKVQFPPDTLAGQTVGDLYTFTGYVTENNIDVQFDKAISFSAKISITGPRAETAGS